MSRVLEAASKRLTPLPEITQEDIDGLVEKCNRLRPIERSAKLQLERQIRVAAVAKRFPHGSILNQDVLRWRWPLRHLKANILRVPVPKLALINLSDPTFFLERLEKSKQESSTLPSGLIERAYGDVIKQLNRATAFGRRYTLSFTWDGVIPQASTEVIQEAEEFFGLYETKEYGKSSRPRVYFLAEAPFDGWIVDSERSPRPPRPRYVDPLIIGHHGENLYVVGSFDPTPLEHYIASEFTS